jgi:hypothetical protein
MKKGEIVTAKTTFNTDSKGNFKIPKNEMLIVIKVDQGNALIQKLHNPWPKAHWVLKKNVDKLVTKLLILFVCCLSLH